MSILNMKLSSYDYRSLDTWAKRLIDTAIYEKVEVVGPIPLPTQKEIVTVLTSPHKHKDAREQFERRTHVRLIRLINPSPRFIKTLQELTFPPTIRVKVKHV